MIWTEDKKYAPVTNLNDAIWHLKVMRGGIRTCKRYAEDDEQRNIDEVQDQALTVVIDSFNSMRTGKWTTDVSSDNRLAEPKDISDEHYHAKYDTVTCPHCGCTLASHVVVGGWYCYHCGGKFGKKNITCDGCDAQYTSRCDCEEGHYVTKTFDCNDCAFCMANCHDMSIACETEESKCDWFELWEGEDESK